MFLVPVLLLKYTIFFFLIAFFKKYCGFQLPCCLGDDAELSNDGSGEVTNRCQTARGHAKGGGHLILP